jgi:hypothetical protein
LAGYRSAWKTRAGASAARTHIGPTRKPAYGPPPPTATGRAAFGQAYWLASKHTGEDEYREHAAALAQGLKNRIAVDTVFKSFPPISAQPLARSSMTNRREKELALAGRADA